MDPIPAVPSPDALFAALRPRCALRCPLCGAANDCAPAAQGHFKTSCWCATASFPPELLAAVPADQRGQACICRTCVERAAGTIPSDG